MFGAFTSLLGGSDGQGQDIIYGSNGQPAGFMGSGSPLLLSWLFGGSVPKGANLPIVNSVRTSSGTFGRPTYGFGGGSGSGSGTAKPGKPVGGGSGGGTSPPPAPPPGGVPQWAFPDYYSDWAFTPPAPFYTPPPPAFNKANYPASTPTTTKK